MKPIPEFPNYLISEDGKVYAIQSRRYLSISANSRGYLRFAVRLDGVVKFLLVHRVIARVYGDLPSLWDYRGVDHEDGNILNNKASNLKVLTKSSHIDKTLSSRGYTRRTEICTSCGNRVRIGSCRKCTPTKLSKYSY